MIPHVLDAGEENILVDNTMPTVFSSKRLLVFCHHQIPNATLDQTVFDARVGEPLFGYTPQVRHGATWSFLGRLSLQFRANLSAEIDCMQSSPSVKDYRLTTSCSLKWIHPFPKSFTHTRKVWIPPRLRWEETLRAPTIAPRKQPHSKT